MNRSLTPVSYRSLPLSLALCLVAVIGTISLIVPGNAATSTSGLVAAYSFDAGTGNTVADLSGNGNTGTLTNVTWSTAGRYGPAASFNGSSSLITVSGSSSLNLTGGMTLEAWVKPKTLGTPGAPSCSRNSPTRSSMRSTPTPKPLSRPGSSIPVAQSARAGVVRRFRSPHGRTSRRPGTQSVRLYVNGNLVASYAASGTMPISTGALRIGGNKVWSEWFDGLIDEVRVYNRALSQAEVQSDLASPIASGQTPPPSDTSPPSVPAGLHTDCGDGDQRLARVDRLDRQRRRHRLHHVFQRCQRRDQCRRELHRRRPHLRDELLLRGRRVRRSRQQVGQELAPERLDGRASRRPRRRIRVRPRHRLPL